MVAAIHLFIKGQWHHTFNIPTEHLHLYSLRPFKWLRYLAYTVSASEADLCSSADGIPVDYSLPSNNPDAFEGDYYYHPNRMFSFN
jgi:hypothetical protein